MGAKYEKEQEEKDAIAAIKIEPNAAKKKKAKKLRILRSDGR